MAGSLHLTLDESTLRHIDVLASRWGLSRSALASFLVNRAFLEEPRVHDLAFEMLSILESINRNTYVTENAIGAGLASRIRRVLKKAHGG